MLFNVHTDKGIHQVEAKNPDEARRVVAGKNSNVRVTKIKLVGGQKPAKAARAAN